MGGSVSIESVVGAAVGGVVGFVTGGPAGALRGAAIGFTLFGSAQAGGQPNLGAGGPQSANRPDPGELATAVGEGAWVPKAYGNRRSGMVLVATDVMDEKEGDSNFAYQIINEGEAGGYATSVYVLGEGPWTKINQLYYNQNKLFKDNQNIQFGVRYGEGHSIWAEDQNYENLEVEFIQGNLEQSTSTMLTEVQRSSSEIANLSNPTVDRQRWFSSTDSGAGICYMVLRIRRDKDAIIRQTAPTNLIIDAQTKQVRDIRQQGSPLVYSTNPALIALDQLRGIYVNDVQTNIFSYGARDNEIDFDSFVNFANYCDDPNEYEGQAPFTINGQFRQGTTIKGILEDIALATGALFEDTSGIIKVQIDKSEPVANGIRITPDNVIANFTRTEPRTSELANVINVQYIDQEGRNFIDVVQFPDSVVNAEGRKEADLELRMVQNPEQAREMGKRALYGARASTFNFDLDLTGYNLDVFNVCNIDDMLDTDVVAEGSSVRIFSVTKQRVGNERAPVRVSAKLYNPQQYHVDPDNSDDISIIPSTATYSDAPSTSFVPTPTGLTLTRISDTSVLVEWDFLGDYQTQIQTRVTDSGNAFVTRLSVVSDDSAELQLNDPGTYDIAIRFVATSGAVGNRVFQQYSSTGITVDTSEHGIIPLDDNQIAFTNQWGEFVYADDENGTGIREAIEPQNEIQQLTNQNHGSHTPVAASVETRLNNAKFHSWTITTPDTFNSGQTTNETYRIAYDPDAIGGPAVLPDPTPNYGWNNTLSTLPYNTGSFAGFEDAFIFNFPGEKYPSTGGFLTLVATLDTGATTVVNNIATNIEFTNQETWDQVYTRLNQFINYGDVEDDTNLQMYVRNEIDTSANTLSLKFTKFGIAGNYSFVIEYRETPDGTPTDVPGSNDGPGGSGPMSNGPSGIPMMMMGSACIDGNCDMGGGAMAFDGGQYFFQDPEQDPPSEFCIEEELPQDAQQSSGCIDSSTNFTTVGEIPSLDWTETSVGSGIWEANVWGSLLSGEPAGQDAVDGDAAIQQAISRGAAFLGQPKSDCSNLILEYTPGSWQGRVDDVGSFLMTTKGPYASLNNGDPEVQPDTDGITDFYVLGPNAFYLRQVHSHGFTGLADEPNRILWYEGDEVIYLTASSTSAPSDWEELRDRPTDEGGNIIGYRIPGSLTSILQGGTQAAVQVTAYFPMSFPGSTPRSFEIQNARIQLADGSEPQTGQVTASTLTKYPVEPGSTVQNVCTTIEYPEDATQEEKILIYLEAVGKATVESKQRQGYDASYTVYNPFPGDAKFPQHDDRIGQPGVAVFWGSNIDEAVEGMFTFPEQKPSTASKPTDMAGNPIPGTDSGETTVFPFDAEVEDESIGTSSVYTPGEPPEPVRLFVDFSVALDIRAFDTTSTERVYKLIINNNDLWNDNEKQALIDHFDNILGYDLGQVTHNQGRWETTLPYNLEGEALWQYVGNAITSQFTTTYYDAETDELTTLVPFEFVTSDHQLILTWRNGHAPVGMTNIGTIQLQRLRTASLAVQESTMSFQTGFANIIMNSQRPAFQDPVLTSYLEVDIPGSNSDVLSNRASRNNMVDYYGHIYAATIATDSMFLDENNSPFDGTEFVYQPISNATGQQFANTIVQQVNEFFTLNGGYTATDGPIDLDTAASVINPNYTRMVTITRNVEMNHGAGPFEFSLVEEDLEFRGLGFQDVRTPYYLPKRFHYDAEKTFNAIRNDHTEKDTGETFYSEQINGETALTEFNDGLGTEYTDQLGNNGFKVTTNTYDELSKITMTLDGSNFEFHQITDKEIPEWLIGDSSLHNDRFNATFDKNAANELGDNGAGIVREESIILTDNFRYGPFTYSGTGTLTISPIPAGFEFLQAGDYILDNADLKIDSVTSNSLIISELAAQTLNPAGNLSDDTGLTIYRNEMTYVYKAIDSDYYMWKRPNLSPSDNLEAFSNESARGWTIGSNNSDDPFYQAIRGEITDLNDTNLNSFGSTNMGLFNLSLFGSDNPNNLQTARFAKISSPALNYANIIDTAQYTLPNFSNFVLTEGAEAVPYIKTDYVMRITDTVPMTINLIDNLDEDGNVITTRPIELGENMSVEIFNGRIPNLTHGGSTSFPSKDQVLIRQPINDNLTNLLDNTYWNYTVDPRDDNYPEIQNLDTVNRTFTLNTSGYVATTTARINRFIQRGAYILSYVQDYFDTAVPHAIIENATWDADERVVTIQVDHIPSEWSNGVRVGPFSYLNLVGESPTNHGTPYGHMPQIFATVVDDFNRLNTNKNYTITDTTHAISTTDGTGIDGYYEWESNLIQPAGSIEPVVDPNYGEGTSAFGTLEPFVEVEQDETNGGFGYTLDRTGGSQAQYTLNFQSPGLPELTETGTYKLTINNATRSFIIKERVSNTQIRIDIPQDRYREGDNNPVTVNRLALSDESNRFDSFLFDQNDDNTFRQITDLSFTSGTEYVVTFSETIPESWDANYLVFRKQVSVFQPGLIEVGNLNNWVLTETAQITGIPSNSGLEIANQNANVVDPAVFTTSLPKTNDTINDIGLLADGTTGTWSFEVGQRRIPVAFATGTTSNDSGRVPIPEDRRTGVVPNLILNLYNDSDTLTTQIELPLVTIEGASYNQFGGYGTDTNITGSTDSYANWVTLADENGLTQEQVDLITSFDNYSIQYKPVTLEFAEFRVLTSPWDLAQSGGPRPTYFGVRSRTSSDSLCEPTHSYDGIADIPGLRPKDNNGYITWKSSFFWVPITNPSNQPLNPQYRIAIRRRPELIWTGAIQSTNGYRAIPVFKGEGVDTQYIINSDTLTVLDIGNIPVYIDNPNAILQGAFNQLDQVNNRYILAKRVISQSDVPDNPVEGNTVFIAVGAPDETPIQLGTLSADRDHFYAYRSDTGTWVDLETIGV